MPKSFIHHFRLNAAFATSVRSYSNSEANTSETAQQPTELEKKLQTDNETLSVQITSLNEKNDELLVRISISTLANFPTITL